LVRPTELLGRAAKFCATLEVHVKPHRSFTAEEVECVQPYQPADRPAVGREAELEAIEALLDVSAAARCLVLAGDPGIGKTTMWEAGCRLARDRGFLVLSARASEAETGLLFAGLADLMENVPPEAMAVLPQPQRHALDIATCRADPDEKASAPFAASAGLLSLLTAAAARTPLLVAIDDAQWLDRASAEALRFAAHRLAYRDPWPIRFLLCRRPGPRTAIEEVFRAAGTLAVRTLTPLSIGAIQRLLARQLPALPPRRVLRQIYEAAQGNPLFALELARLVLEGGVPEPGAELPMPAAAEDIFGPRISALPGPLRTAVLATALSASITRPELACVAGAHAVDDAVGAGLLVALHAGIRLSHPLLGAAARHLSSAAERRQLHLSIAEAVGDPVRQARHRAEASAGPDKELAGNLAAASDAALARGATGDAEQLAASALRLSPPGSPEYPARLLALAHCYLAMGDLTRAGDLLRSGLADLPAGPLRARAHVMLGEASPAIDEEAHLERALAEAADDAELRAYALARKSLVLAVSLVERLDVAETAGLEAVRVAATAGPELRLRALSALAWARIIRGRPVEDLRRSAPPQPEQVSVHGTSIDHPAAVRQAFRGEVAEARVALEQLRALTEECGDARGNLAATIQLCELELRAGDVRRGGSLLADMQEWSGLEEMRTVSFRLRATLAAVAGLPDEAARNAVAARTADSAGLRWDWLEATRAAGIAAVFQGEPKHAAELLGTVWEYTVHEQVDDPGAFPVAGDLVEALVQGGEVERAREVTQRLSVLAARQQHPWAGLTAARCAGVLRLAGEYDHEAADDLAAAAAGYGRLGLRFDQARTLLVLGHEQRRSNKRGAARESLGRAQEVFDVLGCSGWSARAAEELGRVSGRRGADDGLTASEQRVVELAAQGLSNKEIATRLSVTVYTVEAHLSHAYAKLGVRSRAQLAARLTERHSGTSWS
jgi:DNA-binding CsgD family transcriptional regulator